MSYALGFAAFAGVVGSVQAAPPAISAVCSTITADDVLGTAGIPVASADFIAYAPGDDADGSSFVVSSDAAEVLIASNDLLLLAQHHNVAHVDGHIIITIPNKYLNDASKILDLVTTEITSLAELINILIGNHRLPTFDEEHVQQIVDRLSAPAKLTHEAMLAATHVIRQFGIKFATPANLTQTASDPTCDGVCLLLKANNIILELTTLTGELAGKVGLEPVFALVKPIIDAAEALVLQLDGDSLTANPNSSNCAEDDKDHHHRLSAPFHRLHKCMLRKIHLLGFKLAWYTAKKYLHHAVDSESSGACSTVLETEVVAGPMTKCENTISRCELSCYGYGSNYGCEGYKCLNRIS